MPLTMKCGRIAALLGLALAATFAAAPARADIVGELQCNIAPGVGAIVVSSRNVSCVFHSSGAPGQLYSGSINRLGVDIGQINSGTITYEVVAFGVPAPGALAGDYAGPGFGVTLGTGGGLAALVGGGNGAFSLQPVAATTTTGVNVNAGVGALRLAYVGPEAPLLRRHRHHLRRFRHHM